MSTIFNEELLELEKEDAAPSALPSATIGFLAGWHESGVPLVDFAGNTTGDAVCARSTVKVRDAPIGSEVVLIFEGAQPQKPIILGVLLGQGTGETAPPPQDRRLVLSGERELVLQCGAASITLTHAGKIIVEGNYILTRSTGLNRIQGGAVRIN